MERVDSYLLMLEATASIQYNISIILEAKAVEAEKMKRWICNHLCISSYPDHVDQLINPLEFHEKMIETIDGLAKLENSLARNLKVILNKNDDSSGFGGGFGLGDSKDLGGLFGQGSDV